MKFPGIKPETGDDNLGGEEIVEDDLEEMEKISPKCKCSLTSEPDSGPYYVHLGHAAELKEIRGIMEKRSGLKGNIRM